MNYSQRGSRKDTRSSKFTAHAAVQLQRCRWNDNSSLGRNDSVAPDRTLLGDLSDKDNIKVKRLVHDTFPNCIIDNIHRVYAPQMYGMYLLRKEEMQLAKGGYDGQELMLYHVTTESSALESMLTGLDWRRTKRSKYGCGVSFSDDADYANYYANHSTNESTRVIILCAVLVNNTYQVPGKQNVGNLILPPGSADTTMSPNRRVYVKYNDYDFYPLYFMYYQRSLKHLNESKYFNVNLKLPKWQQEQAQRQRDQAQRQREQAQRQREQAQRQREREQAQRQREQAQRQLQRQQAQRQLQREQAQRQLQRERELIWEEEEHQHNQTRQQPTNNCCLIL